MDNLEEQIEEIKKERLKIRTIVKDAFSLRDDNATHDEIESRIVGGGQVTGSNMIILVLAILIASIGLNMNATAVIIGAMLISPLMGSIHLMAYGTATINLNLFRKAGIGFLFQIAFCLVASTVYFLISPISTTTSELLARTQPSIWDVLIAVCGGFAGVIGITRKEKSNVIPGVAIATALMPPLCTCGYAIANGQWRMLAGAGYLFTVNTYFIFLSAAIIFLILEVPQVSHIPDQLGHKIRKALVRNTIVIIVPSLIVAFAMVETASADNSSITNFDQAVQYETVLKEAEVLFPEIDSARIGTMQVLQDDKLVSEDVVVVDENTKLSDEDKEKLEKWVKISCGKTYKVVYNLK